MPGQGVRIQYEVVWTPLPTVVANAWFSSADQLSRLEQPMRDIVEIHSRELEENFASQGRPGPWKPLAESTIRKKGHDTILQDSGALHDAASNADSWAISVSGQSAVAALAAPSYGRFHLTGTRHIPERPWDYISPEAEAESDEILLDWIEEPLESVPWA
jgi:phage gpG-like protein